LSNIKLDNFDYDLIEQYYLKNLLENQFWLFGSHGNEELTPISNNTEDTSRTFLEKSIFGMQYEANDFSFMLPIRLWRPEFVFTQFDDTKILKDEPFFVVIEPEIESGSYHIFKCLSNNYGSKSTEKPEFNPSIQDGIYKLNDGYKWKYMTSTPFSLFRKFSARGLLPVVRNQDVENIAREGIYNIVVENPEQNSGYEEISGNVEGVEIQNGIIRIFLKNLFSDTNNEIPIFDIENTYSGRAIYIEKSNLGSGIGAIELSIRESGVLGNVPFVTVSAPQSFTIESNDIIKILPKIQIIGTGTGASAVAVMEEDKIVDIRILEFGDNYTSAVAIVADPVGFDPTNQNRQDNRCNIRPIISPKGGHGSNVLSELKAKHIGLSKTITNAGTNAEVPISGIYSKVGVVKTPEFEPSANTTFDLPMTGNEIGDIFYVTSDETLYKWEGDPPQWVAKSSFDNRIKIELDSVPGNLEVGDNVTQGEVSAIVHEIDLETNTILVIEYDGPYNTVFDSNLPLRFENSNFGINRIEFPPYISRTGRLLTVTDVTPIERDENRSEQIRLILDF